MSHSKLLSRREFLNSALWTTAKTAGGLGLLTSVGQLLTSSASAAPVPTAFFKRKIPSYNYLGYKAISTDGTSFTFSSVPFGSYATNKKLVILCLSYTPGTPTNVTMTVNGQAATNIGGDLYSAFTCAAPAVTSGTVVVSYTGATIYNSTIFVYEVFDTVGIQYYNPWANAQSFSSNIGVANKYDIILGAAMTGADGVGTHAWTNLTLDTSAGFLVESGTSSASAASKIVAANSTAYTIGFNFTDASSPFIRSSIVRLW